MEKSTLDHKHKGIEVLVADAVHGPVVKPDSVRDVRERTELSDWPMG